MTQFPRAILVSLLAVGPAQAASAPNSLRGKSVIVSWSETRSQRNVGELQFRPVSIHHEFRAYVSSAGRVFSRLTNTNRRGLSGSKDVVGGGQGAKRVHDFTGQTMTVTMTGASRGARRVTVNFDKAFASCTAEVLRGKEVGAGSMTAVSTISGKMVEIQSVTASGASCSVKDGNVFGGE